jgi:hypothetical protein
VSWRGHVLGLGTIAAIGLVLGLAAGRGAAAPPAHGWVGQVPETRTFVGVVQRGNALTAYACDGARVARWYEGRRAGQRAVLRDPRGRRMVVRFSGRGATVALDLPGRRGARAELAPARGRAGLFRRERVVPARAAAPPGTRLEGWVRLNDGRVRGLAAVQGLRVRRPRPGLEVLLRSAPAGPVALAAVVAPPIAARLSPAGGGPCAVIARPPVGGRALEPLRPGPTCGLPAPGLRIGEIRRSARVLSVDADATVSAAALARILGEAPLVRAREEASVVAAAGLPSFPPALPTLAERRGLDAFARALVADREVTEAASALRLARTLEARSARAELYERLGRRVPGRPLGPIDRPEIAIRETGGPGTLRSFTTQTLTSGAAVTEEVTLEGPDAEVRQNRFDLDIIPELASLGGFARVGFHSFAEFSDRAHIEIVVPPGARAVEIQVDGGHFSNFHQQSGCLGGVGGGMAWRAVALWARAADGTYHIADDAPVDGIYFEFEALPVPPPPLPLCLSLTPPIPPPPFIVIHDLPVLRIADPPPGGGRFLVTVEAGGHARTIADAQAWTEHHVALSELVVRTEF